MHIRPHPANVTVNSQKNNAELAALSSFFVRVVCGVSLVSHVGGECWPSAV